MLYKVGECMIGEIIKMSNDYQPSLVSIIMPCYNGQRFIGESIESVMKQSYQDWELLIIDDGSSDDSVALIETYTVKDKRIKLIQQENAGSAAARNHGIKEAQGQYIALLDSDDLWYPEFLTSQIQFMHERKASVVCSSYERIDENSKVFMKPVQARYKITSKAMEAVDYVACLTGLYDRSKHGKIYLDESLNSLLDDYLFWYQAIKFDGVAYGNQRILAQYRIAGNSMTSNKKKLIKKHYQFYRQKLHLNPVQSLINTLKWGWQGVVKYAR